MGTLPPDISSAVTADNPGGYFSLIVLGIMAIFMISGALFGLKRGFSRTVIRLATVIVSAVAAGIIAGALVGRVAAFATGKTLVEAIEEILVATGNTGGLASLGLSEDMINLLSSFDAETTLALAQIIVAVVAVPIVFLVLFWLFKIVTVFIYWIITAVAGLRKRKKKMGSRLLGLAVGAVQGVFIAAVLLLPFAGIAAVARDCREVLTAETVEENKRAENEALFDYWIDDLADSPVLKGISALGGDAIFDAMTSIRVNEHKVPAYDTVTTFVEVYNELGSLGEVDPMAPSPEAQASIEKTVEILASDDFTATIAAGLMRGVNSAVDTGAIVVVAEEPMASFVSSIIDVFEDCNQDNLESDLDTLLHVYFILANNNVLSSFNDANALRDALVAPHEDGKTVIDYVVDELYLNPRTAHIVNSLTELSIRIMCESIGLSENAVHIYENVKTGVNDVLALNESDYATRDEYIEAVSTELDATLKENDINLDQNTLETMSNYIADNYSDVDEITDEDINRALLSYYGAFANGEQPPEGLPEGLPEIPVQ